jgi:uncharacterized protein YjbJ (UPF0337 family)
MDAKLDKAKGKLKVKAGQLAGDKKLASKGHLGEAKGKAKEAMSKVTKAVDKRR